MPFLCGGIVFPDNGGGFWPCRIGNEIRPQGGRTKSTPGGADDILAALGREKVSELLPIGAETAEQQTKGNAICA